MSNEERAARARVFAEAYRDEHDGGEPLSTVIADLMIDLLHLRFALEPDEVEDSPDIDHIDVLARIQMHYEAEVECDDG